MLMATRSSPILAKMADVYCSNAFSTAHRAHNSMMGKVQDYSLEVIDRPTKPMCVTPDGDKVADKI